MVNTAGIRDMMHMRLTNNEAFVRYVGANHPTDYYRLDDWILKLKEWVNAGLQNIHFFIHRNLEVESPIVAAYFVKKINAEFVLDLKIPNENNQQTLL